MRISFFVLVFLLLVACGKEHSSGVHQYAANEDVARYMENFEGRGALTDFNSEPTSPEDAVKDFRYPSDLRFELVLAEPEIVQPLQMSFDHRGRLWVVQYHQYPYPEGLKITAIDNHTRVKFDKTPEAPPHHVKGADRISFFEDTDGDGKYDKATDAIVGLNIATAVTLGRGHIWVLNPPYLLAYPDPDNDGLPNGDPVVHLRGFGLEDTHAVANSLTWGPDGWLYGAMGSTTTANVSSDVTRNVSFSGQAVWRYHPETHIFELFAEGGGNNPFNLEFDSKGRIFSGSNGYGRGPYYKQGAYYIKSWGKHGPLTNPYAFGYLPTMDLEGERKRFTHSLIRYEGGALPARYDGKLFAVNPLHNYVQLTAMYENGSSFRNVDEEVVLQTDDQWFRPVDIKVGPDGAVYLCDWYDSRLSHVDPRDTWHKTSGRIYRLTGDSYSSPRPFDLSKASTSELVELLRHPNKWYRQQALRQFGDRKDASAVPDLLKLLRSEDAQGGLEALWALHLVGALTDNLARETLRHQDPFVRMWTVRLLGDKKQVEAVIAADLARLAFEEKHPEVRSQLAASAKRLPSATALPVLRNLMRSQTHVDDPDIPLQLWWAVEACLKDNTADVVTLFQDPAMWKLPVVEKHILHRLMQRLIMAGGDENYEAAALLLKQVPTRRHAAVLVKGLQEGLLGRDVVEFPEVLQKALAPYSHEMGEAPLAVAIRQGDKSALADALRIVKDEQANVAQRTAYVQVMGEVNAPECVPVLLDVVKGRASTAVKRAALHALAAYDAVEIGREMAKVYPTIRADSYVRESAIALFTLRKTWARDFLREIDTTKVIHPEDVPLQYVKRLRLLRDPDVDRVVDKVWPESRPLTAEEKTTRITHYARLLKAGRNKDLARGRELYLMNCGMCHRLNDEGGQLGPELTGYDRGDLDNMLLHIIDPNADIREGYELHRVVTVDGRVLEGRVTQQMGETITLAPPLGGKPTALPRSRIAEIEVLPVSFMPERIFDVLEEQEVIDLMGYLTEQSK